MRLIFNHQISPNSRILRNVHSRILRNVQHINSAQDGTGPSNDCAFGDKAAGEKYGLAGEFQLLKFEGFLTPYINYFGHPKEVMKPTPKKEYQNLAEKYKGEVRLCEQTSCYPTN